MKLVKIVPENFKMDGGACFGVVPKAIWSKLVPDEENNLVKVASRCLLVDTNQRVILVDTGIGNKQSEKYLSHFNIFDNVGLEGAISKSGYKNTDITDVILTHLHFDHVGGALKWDGDSKIPIPVFPNAAYYCSKAQWDTAQRPNPREKASFHPENFNSLFENGRLEFINENTTFCKNVELEIKNGHTLGQIIPIISYKGRKVAFMADFIPTVYNIPLAYITSFDIYPLKAMEEKEHFLQRAVDEEYILFFEHDYYNECCTLVKTPKGVARGEVFSLDNL